MIYRTVTVEPIFSDNVVAVDADISKNISANAELTSLIRTTNYEEYSGATTVTPSAETQVLATADRVILENITINPIPPNYGLITWDGSTLTVS